MMEDINQEMTTETYQKQHDVDNTTFHMFEQLGNLDTGLTPVAEGDSDEKRENALIELIRRLTVQCRFEEVKHMIREIDVGRGNREQFIALWDEVHYREKELKLGKPLTSLIKFRIRSRFVPPVNLCPSGVREVTSFPKHSRRILNDWLEEHLDHPYPSNNDKERLARESALSVVQVSTWFANHRRHLRKQQQMSPSAQARMKKRGGGDGDANDNNPPFSNTTTVFDGGPKRLKLINSNAQQCLAPSKRPQDAPVITLPAVAPPTFAVLPDDLRYLDKNNNVIVRKANRNHQPAWQLGACARSTLENNGTSLGGTGQMPVNFTRHPSLQFPEKIQPPFLRCNNNVDLSNYGVNQAWAGLRGNVNEPAVTNTPQMPTPHVVPAMALQTNQRYADNHTLNAAKIHLGSVEYKQRPHDVEKAKMLSEASLQLPREAAWGSSRNAPAQIHIPPAPPIHKVAANYQGFPYSQPFPPMQFPPQVPDMSANLMANDQKDLHLGEPNSMVAGDMSQMNYYTVYERTWSRGPADGYAPYGNIAPGSSEFMAPPGDTNQNYMGHAAYNCAPPPISGPAPTLTSTTWVNPPQAPKTLTLPSALPSSGGSRDGRSESCTLNLASLKWATPNVAATYVSSSSPSTQFSGSSSDDVTPIQVLPDVSVKETPQRRCGSARYDNEPPSFVNVSMPLVTPNQSQTAPSDVLPNTNLRGYRVVTVSNRHTAPKYYPSAAPQRQRYDATRYAYNRPNQRVIDVSAHCVSSHAPLLSLSRLKTEDAMPTMASASQLCPSEGPNPHQLSEQERPLPLFWPQCSLYHPTPVVKTECVDYMGQIIPGSSVTSAPVMSDSPQTRFAQLIPPLRVTLPAWGPPDADLCRVFSPGPQATSTPFPGQLAGLLATDAPTQTAEQPGQFMNLERTSTVCSAFDPNDLAVPNALVDPNALNDRNTAMDHVALSEPCEGGLNCTTESDSIINVHTTVESECVKDEVAVPAEHLETGHSCI